MSEKQFDIQDILSSIPHVTDHTTTPMMSRSSTRIIENFIVIWLDLGMSNTDDSIFEVRRAVKSFQTFNDCDACVDFLTDVKDKKVFLIVSGALFEALVSLIHDITHLNSIYFFCENQDKYQHWGKQWKKVKGTFTDIFILCDQLKRKIRQCDQDLTSISISSVSTDLNLNELNQSFMYSQLLKETLLGMQYDEQAKQHFVNFLRTEYNGDNVELRAIDEFEQNYDLHSPIWWYTKEWFIYSMLNKALRIDDVDTAIKMGVFIVKLHRQIEQIRKESNNRHRLTVYRGQGMLNVDFEKMCNSEGGLLSFNNFLSTSTDREVSYLFADSARADPDLTGILFQMDIDPTVSSTPFAQLGNISYYSDMEQEILFSMHAVFRIEEIIQIDESLWEVKLILTSDNDEQLDRLTKHFLEEIGEASGWFQVAQLMIKMGKFDKAEDIYKALLESTSEDNHPGLASINHQLGYVNHLRNNLTSALFYYKRSLVSKMINLPPDHPRLSETYAGVGMIFKAQGNLEAALKAFQHALDINLHAPQPDQPAIATLLNNTAGILVVENKYDEALKTYGRVLEIQLNHLPSSHPSLAVTYNNIGRVHAVMRNYPCALPYFEKALQIQLKSLPPDHPELTITYNNIGGVHASIGDYRQALWFLEKTLKIQIKSLPVNHPSLADSYRNIGNMLRRMGEFRRALSSFEKALEIQLKSLPSDCEALAITYNGLGLIHRTIGNYSLALPYYEKSLEILQKALPSDHQLLAITYNNIGLLQKSMGNNSAALSNYERTLEIQLKSLPPNHLSLVLIYNNIGMAHQAMRNQLSALWNCKKALEIQLESLPSDHLSLAATYSNIGRVYRSMKDYLIALSYYEKALEIQQKCLPPNNPSQIIPYYNIGEMYTSMGKYSDALFYLQKALEIQQKCPTFNKRELFALHSNMAKVYQGLHRFAEAAEHAKKARELAHNYSGLTNLSF